MDSYSVAKEAHKDGRRFYKNEEQLHRRQKSSVFMEKFLIDPKYKLSENRKRELLRDDSDGMLLNVLYSVNKHGRWKRADAEHLLPGDRKKDLDVALVHRAYTYDHEKDLATSASFLKEDGSISTAYSPHCTSRDLDLLYNASGKTWETDKEKRKFTNARLEYIIHTVHPNPDRFRKAFIWKGKNRDHLNRTEGNRGATNDKYLEDRFYCGCKETCPVCHLEPCPWRFGTLESEEEEEDAEKEEEKREYRLNLEECIRQPVLRQKTEKRKRRRENTDSGFEVVKNTTNGQMDNISIDGETSTSSASEVVPFRFDNGKKGLFERILIESKKWAGKSLETEAEALNGDVYEVCWLNSDRTRVTIDASRALLHSETHTKQTLVVTVEEARKGWKRFTFNSVFAPSFNEATTELQRNLSKTKNLKDFMLKTVQTFKSWKRQTLSASDSLTSDCLTSRFTRRPHLFSREVNSTMDSEVAKLIDPSEIQKTIENFLSSETIGEVAEINMDSAGNANCFSCGCGDQFELFPVNNSNFCWICLRQLIFMKLRTSGDKKMEISLPTASFFDILPLFVPLSIVNEYAQFLAENSCDQFSLSKPKWIKCPSCSSLLEARSNTTSLSTICPTCNIVFCASCSQPPHFPMECEENKKWMEIFDTQVAVYNCASDEPDSTIYRITCECGVVIEVNSQSEYAKCSWCSLEFNPSTFCLIHPKKSFYVDYYEQKNINIPPKYLYFYHQGVQWVQVKDSVERRMLKLALECRFDRLDAEKRRKIIFSTRKLETKSENKYNRVVELRNTVLSLIENTIGWLKVHENSVEEKKKIMRMLKKIKEIYDALMIFLDRKDVNIEVALARLENRYYKIVDYLKKSEELYFCSVFPTNCFSSTVVFSFKEERNSREGSELDDLSYVGAKFA